MENKEIFDIWFLFFCAVGGTLMLISIATIVFNEIIKRLSQWKKTLEEVRRDGK